MSGARSASSRGLLSAFLAPVSGFRVQGQGLLYREKVFACLSVSTGVRVEGYIPVQGSRFEC